MAKVVIECAQCGATLGVPHKKNTVECPICSNEITLAFHPGERHTPSWLRMELGLIIVVVSLVIWTNSSSLEGYLFEGAEDLLVAGASWSCFGGVLLVAFAGLIRNRDRLMGDRGRGKSYGRGFYVGLLLPLLMSLVAMLIPPVFNLCRWASEGPCNVIGHNNYILIIAWTPFATALPLVLYGALNHEKDNRDLIDGSAISAVLTFAYGIVVSLLIMIGTTN